MAVPPLAFRLKYAPDKVSKRWFVGMALYGLLFMLSVAVLLWVMSPAPSAGPVPSQPIHQGSQR